MPDTTQHDDAFEELLGRHLEGRAAALHLAPGTLDEVPVRAHRQVRRSKLVRTGLAACCSVAVLAIGIGIGITRPDDAGVTASELIDTAVGGQVAPVASAAVGSAAPGNAVLFDGVLWATVYDPDVSVSTSVDGVEWTPADIPALAAFERSDIESRGISIVASDTHLVLLLVGNGGSTALSTTDGTNWETTDLGGPAWLNAAASSPTHVFVTMQRLSEEAIQRTTLEDETQQALKERFGEFDGYGVSSSSSSPDSAELEVNLQRETLYKGPISESGLPDDIIDYLVAGTQPRDEEPSDFRTLASVDGVTWTEVETAEYAFDRGQVFSSNVGLVLLDGEVGARRTLDGMTFDAFPALGQFDYIESIRSSPFGIFVQANGGVYRAESLDGPFGLVDLGRSDGQNEQSQVFTSPQGVLLLVSSYDYPEVEPLVEGGVESIETGHSPFDGMEQLVVVIEQDGNTIEVSLAEGVRIVLPDGRVVVYSNDELDGAIESDNIVLDDTSGEATFLDPDTGEVLAVLTPDDVFEAIAEQHPEHAEAAQQVLDRRDFSVSEEVSSSGYSVGFGEAEPSDTPTVTLNAYVSTDGIRFRTVTLEQSDGFGWISAVTAPDGRFVVTVHGADDAATAFIVDPTAD